VNLVNVRLHEPSIIQYVQTLFQFVGGQHMSEEGKKRGKNVFGALQAQHIVEYLRFEYFMPPASQLHLQFHVIQVLSRRKQAT
jgi:hypothetical protein